MPRITPCLWFEHEAEDAAGFYVAIFPNSRIVATTRQGDAGPGGKGAVVAVTFELDGQKFTALNGRPQFTFNDAISLCIDCETQEQVDHFWSRLTERGEEGRCGWLKDRFGLSWQVIPADLGRLLADPDPARARRVLEAMLAMKKIDIAGLRRAHAGA